MKKIMSFLFIVVFCLSLCACGGESASATVTDYDGNTVQMSAKNLASVYKENGAKFKKYVGNDISFVGTVKSVESASRRNGDNFTTNVIVFQEGWRVIIMEGDYNGLAFELSKGDKVSVSSQIYSCFGNSIEVAGIDEGSNCYTRSSIRNSVLEKVN